MFETNARAHTHTHIDASHIVHTPCTYRHKAWEQEALIAKRTACRSWQIPHCPAARLSCIRSFMR